ncbi:methionine synthase, partial [Nocardioides sp. SOB44]|nr:methionine synthase [Nocardioides cremeus]
AEGAEPWVHSCSAGTPRALRRGAGARGLLVAVARLAAADHDVLAEALEAGDVVVLGLVPSTDPQGAVSDTA